MAFMAPLVEALGVGGAEAGGIAGAEGGGGLLGGIGGFMGNHPFLMGNLMGRAMAGGGTPGMAQMGPSPDASVAEPMVGVTGKVGADMFGEDEVGMATQNRGDNSDPDQQSSSGADTEERGDSPEQLKDIGGQATSPAPADDLNNQGGADGDLRETATNAFHSNLPLILEFAFSDQSGADHPILKALDELLESAFPGYKDVDPLLQEMDGGADTTETGVSPEDPENPTEKLEGELGQDLDGDSKADEPEKEEDEAKRIARAAGYCPDCWGPIDVLGRCASTHHSSDVPPAPWPVGSRVRHVDEVHQPDNFSTIRKVNKTPYGFSYDLENRGEQVPGVPHNADLVYVDGGKPEPNYFPPTGPGVFNKFPNIQPGDAEHFDPRFFPKGAHALLKEADVPGPPAATGMGYATDTSAQTNMTGIPTCPLCHQNHAAGTPCPTPQSQAPVAPATNVSPAAGSFAIPMQPSKVVTKYQIVTAEFDHEELEPPDPMHNESYEDGEEPDTGWYEDWQGPDKDDEKHPWVDDSGKPLEEGQEYDMHSTGYAIPDKIKVLAVTPNKLTYELEAGDIAYKDTITTDDVYKQGYTFKPAKPGDDPGMEVQPERKPLETGAHPIRPGADPSPQVDDLSNVQPKMGGQIADFMNWEGIGPAVDEFKNAVKNLPRDMRNGFQEPEIGDEAEEGDICPYCMRPDPSVAELGGVCWHCKQNNDMEDAGYGLDSTRGVVEGGVQKMGGDTCDKCGNHHSDDGYDWDCKHCGHHNERSYDPGTGEPHTPEDAFTDEEESHYFGSFKGDNPDARAWLNDPGLGQGVDVDPFTMAKIAGKDYSPREQREFIDEHGEARNLHRLNLEGTHYELDGYGDSLW